VTLTYYGAEKVVPKYNVMGVAKAALEASVRYLANDLGGRNIRVNAISAGPIKTLAARGISGLGEMLKSHAERAPLKRNVDPEKWAARQRFYCRKRDQELRARPFTWIADTTSWVFEFWKWRAGNALLSFAV